MNSHSSLLHLVCICAHSIKQNIDKLTDLHDVSSASDLNSSVTQLEQFCFSLSVFWDAVSWNIYPSFLFDLLCKIFIKLNCFPGSIPIVGAWEAVETFSVWHFIGSGRESGV